jgi:hypothetical protein
LFSGGAALPFGDSRKPSRSAGNRTLMKVGTDTSIDEERFKYLARFGVKNVCAGPKPADG